MSAFRVQPLKHIFQITNKIIPIGWKLKYRTVSMTELNRIELNNAKTGEDFTEGGICKEDGGQGGDLFEHCYHCVVGGPT